MGCPDPIQRLSLSLNRMEPEDIARILRTVYNHHSYPWRDENENLWPLTLELGGNPGMGSFKDVVREEKQGGEDKVVFCFEPERPSDPAAYQHFFGPCINEARLFVHIPVLEDHLRPRRRLPQPRRLASAQRALTTSAREDSEATPGVKRAPIREEPKTRLAHTIGEESE